MTAHYGIGGGGGARTDVHVRFFPLKMEPDTAWISEKK